MTTDEALTELTSLSSEEDTVTSESAVKVTGLLLSVLSLTSSEGELASVAGVLSNLVSTAEGGSSLSVANGIKGVTDKITENAI